MSDSEHTRGQNEYQKTQVGGVLASKPVQTGPYIVLRIYLICVPCLRAPCVWNSIESCSAVFRTVINKLIVLDTAPIIGLPTNRRKLGGPRRHVTRSREDIHKIHRDVRKIHLK